MKWNAILRMRSWSITQHQRKCSRMLIWMSSAKWFKPRELKNQLDQLSKRPRAGSMNIKDLWIIHHWLRKLKSLQGCLCVTCRHTKQENSSNPKCLNDNETHCKMTKWKAIVETSALSIKDLSKPPSQLGGSTSSWIITARWLIHSIKTFTRWHYLNKGTLNHSKRPHHLIEGKSWISIPNTKLWPSFRL